MTKLQRITERLQATVAGQTEDPEHLLDVLIAAWEEMHREAIQVRGLVAERDRYREALETIREMEHKAPYDATWRPWTVAREALDVANPVTEDRIQRAAYALAAECGEEDVEDAIVRLGYLESARKALAAAFDPTYNGTVAPSAPRRQP